MASVGVAGDLVDRPGGVRGQAGDLGAFGGRRLAEVLQHLQAGRESNRARTRASMLSTMILNGPVLQARPRPAGARRSAGTGRARRRAPPRPAPRCRRCRPRPSFHRRPRRPSCRRRRSCRSLVPAAPWSPPNPDVEPAAPVVPRRLAGPRRPDPSDAGTGATGRSARSRFRSRSRVVPAEPVFGGMPLLPSLH